MKKYLFISLLLLSFGMMTACSSKTQSISSASQSTQASSLANSQEKPSKSSTSSSKKESEENSASEVYEEKASASESSSVTETKATKTLKLGAGLMYSEFGIGEQTFTISEGETKEVPMNMSESNPAEYAFYQLLLVKNLATPSMEKKELPLGQTSVSYDEVKDYDAIVVVDISKALAKNMKVYPYDGSKESADSSSSNQASGSGPYAVSLSGSNRFRGGGGVNAPNVIDIDMDSKTVKFYYQRAGSVSGGDLAEETSFTSQDIATKEIRIFSIGTNKIRTVKVNTMYQLANGDTFYVFHNASGGISLITPNYAGNVEADQTDVQLEYVLQDSGAVVSSSASPSPSSTSWNASKQASLDRYMLSWQAEMKQSYTSYTPTSKGSFYGLPVPYLGDGKMTILLNNQPVSVSWSETGDLPGYNLVACYSGGKSNQQGEQYLYYFVIKDGKGEVWVCQQTQGNENNYLYFTHTQNQALSGQFANIVTQ